MEPITPVELGNAIIVWLEFVAVLFIGTQTTFEKFVKPILHIIRDRTGLPNEMYIILTQLVVLVMTFIGAWMAREQLDLFANALRIYDYHPFVGAVPAAFACVLCGQQINDRFGKTKPVKKEPTDNA